MYYEWGHDYKRPHAKITMEKYVKKLVDRYEKFNGIDLKVQKTPGAPGATLGKSEI